MMPSIQAWSTMVCSMRLIVTLPPVCSSAMDSTHAVSHGAGHSLPVNSGKLLVRAGDHWRRPSDRGGRGRSIPG